MYRHASQCVRHVRSLTAGVLCFLAFFPTDGSADVLHDGAYTTNMSVEVPGYYGITPQISAFYSSRAASGPLGMGWMLQAGSTIERTSKGEGAPRFDDSDRLWLDGQEIVACDRLPANVSCRFGGTHTTRVETFRRLTFNAASNTWKVWTKDGVVREYAPLAAPVMPAGQTLRWALRGVTDTTGHSVGYSYACDGQRACYLDTIAYGAGEACPPSPGAPPLPPDRPATAPGTILPGASIRFFWDTRPDPQFTAHGTSNNVLEERRWRLNAIDVTQAGVRLRNYQFRYQPQPQGAADAFNVGRSWLTGIQMYGADAQINLAGVVMSGTPAPPLTFDAPAQAQVPSPPFTFPVVAGDLFLPLAPPAAATFGAFASTYDRAWISRLPIDTVNSGLSLSGEPIIRQTSTSDFARGDFDGDGRLDFAEWKLAGDCIRFDLRVTRASAQDRTSAVNSPPQNFSSGDPACSERVTRTYAVDLDRDGRTDLLFLHFRREDPFSATDLRFSAELRPALSNGDGSFDFGPTRPLWIGANRQEALTSKCAVGDIDGDARPDLSCFVRLQGGWQIIQALPDVGGVFAIRTNPDAGTFAATSLLSVADVDGDRLGDFAVVNQTAPGAPLVLRVGRSRDDGGIVWSEHTTAFPGPSAVDEAQLLMGEFNGDGRQDVLVAIKRAASNVFITIASTGGAFGQFSVSQKIVTGAMPALSMGDSDGDALEDLFLAVHHDAHDASRCGRSVAAPHASLLIARSSPASGFGLPSDFGGCYDDRTFFGSSPNWRDPENPSAAMVNADHRADWLQVTQVPNDTVFFVHDLASYATANEWSSWRSTDINGDGRTDWVSAAFANPGLQVGALITQLDGTRRRFHADIDVASPAFPHLRDVSASRVWYVADVAGRDGAEPDGRADLVFVDDTARVFVTLVGQGNGQWRKVASQYATQGQTAIRGHVPGNRHGDVGNWRLIDVNGDGLSDLVHTSPFQTGGLATGEVRVATYFAVGDGTWSNPVVDGHFGNQFTDTNVSDFTPIDLDGDRRLDLVKIQRSPTVQSGTSVLIWTLMSRGDGTWQPRRQPMDQIFHAVGKWRTMEVNGDRRTDLVFLSTPPNGRLAVATMLSNGDGSFQPMQLDSPDATSTADPGAAGDYVISDLDSDGRDDILQVSGQGGANDLGATTLVAAPGARITYVWNRYPNFVQGPLSAATPVSAIDRRTWRLIQFDADQRPEFVRTPASVQDNLAVIALPVPDSRMQRTGNGLGGYEAVRYTTSIGAHANMPIGSVLGVVAGVQVFAGDGEIPVVSREYAYEGATFSWYKRRFIGFSKVRVSDGRAIRVTDYELLDTCGARPSSLEVWTPADILMARRLLRYVATPARGGRLCQLASATREEWEGVSTPRISGEEYRYDDFGNEAMRLVLGDLGDAMDDRRITTDFIPNLDAFIVDRPASQTIDAAAPGGASVRLSETHFIHDDAPDHLAGPWAGKGLLTARQEWTGTPATFATTRFAYDVRGNLARITLPPTPTNPGGIWTTIECDCDFKRVPVKTCDAVGCVNDVWDEGLNRVRASIDSSGRTVVSTYDPLGRLASVTRPGGAFERWTYPGEAQWRTDRAILHEVADGPTPQAFLWDKTLFDGLGRVTQTLREGNVVETSMSYDLDTTRIATSALPRFAGQQPLAVTTTYDALGRPIRVENADGSQQRWIRGVGVVRAVDEIGAATDFQIDVFGRITAVGEAMRACVGEGCPIVRSLWTRYAYDGLDRLTQVTDTVGHISSLTWLPRDLLQVSCDPDRGCTSFDYADDGSLLTKTDSKGAVRTSAYDIMGREITRTFTEPTGTISKAVRWTWDRDPSATTPTSDALRQVVRVDEVQPGVVMWSVFGFDPAGRVSAVKSCVDARCATFAMTFDQVGRTETMTYPDAQGVISASSERLRYAYDTRGLLRSIRGVVNSIDYDAAGWAQTWRFANGTTEQRPRDRARGWALGASITRTPGNTRLFTQDLSRDVAGRISREQLSLPTGRWRDDFTHDDLDRLTGVRSTRPARNRTFEYDDIGNMTLDSSRGKMVYDDPTHVHALTQIGAGPKMEYDKVGQLIQSDRLRFTWNAANWPTSVTEFATNSSTNYVHAHTGARVRVSSPAGGVVSQPHPLVEFGPAGQMTASISANGRIIARRSGGKTLYLHSDALGSLRLISDSKGAVAGSRQYGTWGENLTSPGGPSVPFGYSGGRVEGTNGLVLLGARYYDPGLAHFVSPDSTVPDIFNPQFLNRFSYALNDPASLSDPSGHAPEQGGVVSFPPVAITVQPSAIEDWEPFPTTPTPPPFVNAPPAVNQSRVLPEYSGVQNFYNAMDRERTFRESGLRRTTPPPPPGPEKVFDPNAWKTFLPEYFENRVLPQDPRERSLAMAGTTTALNSLKLTTSSRSFANTGAAISGQVGFFGGIPALPPNLYTPRMDGANFGVGAGLLQGNAIRSIYSATNEQSDLMDTVYKEGFSSPEVYKQYSPWNAVDWVSGGTFLSGDRGIPQR